MKTILTFLFLLSICLINPAWAQQEKGVLVGLSSQLSLRKLTFRTSTSPVIGYQSNRHQFTTGLILLTKDFDGTSSNRLMLNGLHINYRYLLTRNPQKKLHWLVSITSMGQCFKEAWQSNYWDTEKQTYTDIQQESRELLWENYAGIGFQYPLRNRLALSANTHIGYAYSSLRRSGLSLEVTDNQFDYRGYEKTEFVYAINVGVHILLGRQQ